MNKKVIITVLIFAILIVLSMIIIQIKDIKDKIVEKTKKTISYITNLGSEDSEETKENNEENENMGAGGGGGGAGDGGGSKGSEYFDSTINPICAEQISYSITNFKRTELCTEYNQEICIKKTVTCSVEIRNREEDIEGFVGIRTSFVKIGGNISNPIKQEDIRFFLGPQQSKNIESTALIESTGIDGNANKIINCLYNTIEIPNKC